MTRRVHLDPGQLSHRFELEKIIETSDGMGGTTISWETVAHVWGSLSPVRARSLELAQQIDERLTHRIVIRFRDDVQSGWRFIKENRLFVIKSIADADETKRYLNCDTLEQGR